MSWPGVLRAIGACHLRSRAAASITRPQDESAGSHDEPQEGALRKAARIARPLILTIAAGRAFAALLRFHHAKFEDNMVRAFQKQQLDATRSWADATEKQVAVIRRDLAYLASDSDVRRFAPTMREALSACLTRESTVLDTLEVFDAQGATLWSSLTTATSEPRNEAGQAGSSSTLAETRRRLHLRLPIELDGKQVGTLQASVNVLGVTFRCQPKADSTYKSLCLLLSGTGEVIYGSDTISKPRQVIHALRDADAPKEAVLRPLPATRHLLHRNRSGIPRKPCGLQMGTRRQSASSSARSSKISVRRCPRPKTPRWRRMRTSLREWHTDGRDRWACLAPGGPWPVPSALRKYAGLESRNVYWGVSGNCMPNYSWLREPCPTPNRRLPHADPRSRR